MDCVVHGILQARILEWVAFPFSRGSSQPRDRTQGLSHIVGKFFTSWATREAQLWGNIRQIQTEDHFTKYLTTTLQNYQGQKKKKKKKKKKNYQGPEEQDKTEKLLQIRGDFREEHFGNPLQLFSLGKSEWWATVHRVTKSQTQLKRFSMQRRIRIKDN